jgi:sigma-B regulation protein RsbU (phosphoserine phosphatase)
VNGAAATVFVADVVNAARLRTGQVFVAFQDPAVPAQDGGSKLGLLMLVLGPLLVGGLGFVVANGHGKPIKDLARELDRLGTTGDPSRRISAHGPEANAIARSVERMVANLKFREQHEMADLQEATAKVEGTAAEIHHGLMPRNPPRLPGWEVETLFKPGFEIGGDSFDYFRIDDTHLGVILMDTSVRGIQAALVMAMARAYVRAHAPGVLSPAELLTKVNRLLAADLSQGQYVTALYVVIDTGNGTAKVASAGHLPLVVYRHAIGKTAVVNPEGIALGLDVGPVFDRSVTEVDVDIGVGDRLVLHTDGALKVQNDAGDEYGEARLYDAIKQKAPMNSQAFVNFVGSAIDLFHATTPQYDDITLSTVKRLK